MFKYIKSINARQLLEIWQKSGMIEANKFSQIERFIQIQQQKQDLPLSLYIVVGIGSFITSIFLIGFLTASNIINLDSKTELIFWGLIFICLALLLFKVSKNKDSTIKNIFLIQNSLCTMGIGKILFIMGFSEIFDNKICCLEIPFAIFIITAATYHVYNVSLDRFLSTLAIFISLLMNIMQKKYFLISTDMLLNMFFLIQIMFAAFLLTYDKIKCDYVPLKYATLFSLCFTVILYTLKPTIDIWANHQPDTLIFINIILTISLICLIVWIVGDLKKLKTEPLILACFGSIILGLISASSVIFAICLIVLGYAKYEKLILFMGIFLMPIFIFLYYYNLNISLMAKSAVLVGSGIVLIVGHSYLKIKKLDQEKI